MAYNQDQTAAAEILLASMATPSPSPTSSDTDSTGYDSDSSSCPSLVSDNGSRASSCSSRTDYDESDYDDFSSSSDFESDDDSNFDQDAWLDDLPDPGDEDLGPQPMGIALPLRSEGTRATVDAVMAHADREEGRVVALAWEGPGQQRTAMETPPGIALPVRPAQGVTGTQQPMGSQPSVRERRLLGQEEEKEMVASSEGRMSVDEEGAERGQKRQKK